MSASLLKYSFNSWVTWGWSAEDWWCGKDTDWLLAWVSPSLPWYEVQRHCKWSPQHSVRHTHLVMVLPDSSWGYPSLGVGRPEHPQVYRAAPLEDGHHHLHPCRWRAPFSIYPLVAGVYGGAWPTTIKIGQETSVIHKLHFPPFDLRIRMIQWM